MNLLLSICIPAFKQPDLLLRCLNSIKCQDYPSFEVIITDDSEDDSVSKVIDAFGDKMKIKYYKNEFSLGSPRNWNKAIEYSSGDLILVLHHDDWLISNDSLTNFVYPFTIDANIDFVFGKINFIKTRYFNKIYYFLCKNKIKEPLSLIEDNFIGPPSNVMFKSDLKQYFNEDYLWLVDVDFYLRLISEGRTFFYINNKLIDTGRHDAQITSKLLGKHYIKFIEYNNIMNKYSTKKHIPFRLYDFYWRILRNGGDELNRNIFNNKTSEFQLNTVFNFQINCQKYIVRPLLINKLFSRFAICVSYIFYKFLY